MSTVQGDEEARLPLLYEKHLSHSIRTDLAAYCDKHDLIALVSEKDQDIVIYRINGQIAFRINRKSPDVDVTVVKWKTDGTLLGVAWSDGSCGVYSGENGKLLSETSVTENSRQDDWKLDLQPDYDVGSDEDGDSASANCMGWTAHEVSTKQPAKGTVGSDYATTEDWYDRTANDDSNGEIHKGKAAGIADLANSIVTLDVTSNMLKLSAIPSHGVRSGPDGSKFSTQTNLDGLFDPGDRSSRDVDTLVVAGNSGYVGVLLDDSVKVGSFHIPHSPTIHASHPQCRSQVLLSDASVDLTRHLHYIDLPLETLSGSLLHIVALNTKRIQNLIAYVTQTVRCIQHDFVTGLQFPTRLMTNINEELNEKQEGDLITNLTHLAMTGSFTPTMLEWLTDIVKETNHKRWDNAVNTMYNHIQNHIFENLLPALDRLSIAASALRGHAKFHDGTSKFVDPCIFTTLIDDVDSIRLIAKKMQDVIMTEHRQFRAFIKWMRVMIEVGVAGPGTKGANETEEREAQNLDYALLLAYIRDTLKRSRLGYYVEHLPELRGTCSRSEFFAHPILSALNRERTVQSLKMRATPSDGTDSNPQHIQDPYNGVNLEALTVRLAAQARVAIESITEWQSRMLLAPTTLPLDESQNIPPDAKVLDIAMSPSSDVNVDSVVRLLSVPVTSEPTQLSIHEVKRLVETSGYESSHTQLDLKGDILVHTKLIDKSSSLILYKRAMDGGYVLSECTLSTDDLGVHIINNAPLHLFDDDGFTPTHFLVGGRPGMMVCVIFGNDGRDWRVLDLRRTANDNGFDNDEMEL